MNKLSILLLFFIANVTIAQQGGNAHFIEANKLAKEGKCRTAFALIQNEAENEFDCNALGYYWIWSLQYGTPINDSTYSFNESTNTKLSISFDYQFKKKQMLQELKKTCEYNGLVNKALGHYYWEKAMSSTEFNAEEQWVDLAVFHLRLAIRGGAYDTFTTFNLARGLEYQTKCGEAIKYYKKTYALDDSHMNSLLKIAACFGNLSEWDSCLTYANRAYLLSNVILEKATALRLEAEALAAKENRKKAKKLFKAAIKMVPSDYDNNIAYIEFLLATKRKKACRKAVPLLKEHFKNGDIHIAYDFLFEDKEKLWIYQKTEKITSLKVADYLAI